MLESLKLPGGGGNKHGLLANGRAPKLVLLSVHVKPDPSFRTNCHWLKLRNFAFYNQGGHGDASVLLKHAPRKETKKFKVKDVFLGSASTFRQEGTEFGDLDQPEMTPQIHRSTARWSFVCGKQPTHCRHALVRFHGKTTSKV